jgi:hypothetical protein
MMESFGKHTARLTIAFLAAMLFSSASGSTLLGCPNDETTPEQVLAAWDRHRQKIDSFRYDYELKQAVANVENRLDHRRPLGGQAKKDVNGAGSRRVGFQKSLTLRVFKNKTAYKEVGEQWSPELDCKVTVQHIFTFDGTHTKVLLKDPLRSVGQIEKGDLFGFLHGNQSGLWVAHATAEWLTKRVACRPADMKIGRPAVRFDGQEHLELTLENGSWKHFILVDPSRDYVPVRVIGKHDGIIRWELSIQYTRDKNVSWRPTSWLTRSYNESGSEKETRLFSVKRCSFNGPVAADVFTIKFPKGTEVVEHVDGEERSFVAPGDE